MITNVTKVIACVYEIHRPILTKSGSQKYLLLSQKNYDVRGMLH